MRIYKQLITLAFLISFGNGVVVAGHFAKGAEALISGDFITALSELRPLAEQGDARAQYNLGVMYGNGNGVLKDNKICLKWYTLAAEQGHADAQYNLGAMWDNGKGIVESNQAAVKWYTLAAKQGDADAQYNLGAMWDNGKGIVESNQAAVKWYTLAVEQGHLGAQLLAGNLTITDGLVGTDIVTVNSTNWADGINGGVTSNYSLAIGESIAAIEFHIRVPESARH